MTEEIKSKSIVFSIGRRKSAIARVRILAEKGNDIVITINKKDYKIYLPYFEWQQSLLSPLKVTGHDKINISVMVKGGGIKGQVDAIKHGIAKALLKMDENYRAALRKEGLLTRDSRIKERKKPGLKKARRAPQWSKR
ncbi:MAG: small subunit ribosomal protein [Patescibacteria group bacterium]|nr:small subunit ribosomal protein [Patescibacteria group bacterium]MDQ5970586.1 small subunit ribosomal protein [Patescibacteria group bacterium]